MGGWSSAPASPPPRRSWAGSGSAATTSARSGRRHWTSSRACWWRSRSRATRASSWTWRRAMWCPSRCSGPTLRCGWPARTGVELGAHLLQEGLGSLRGAIGTPAQIRELIRGYQAAGVDQLVFVSQAGRTRHEHTCESLELFALEVMPEFAEQADEHDRDKAERLAGAVEAALARCDPPRTPPGDYTISGAMQF